MATLPSELPSDNVSCHRALIYLCALFIDTCTQVRTAVPAPPLCYGPAWPPSASPCFSSRSSTAPHLHLLMEKVTLATWPAIWRGPGGYPKQAKHNPITPQGDTPHLLNPAWVIFCFSLGACKRSTYMFMVSRELESTDVLRGSNSCCVQLLHPLLLWIWWVWFQVHSLILQRKNALCSLICQKSGAFFFFDGRPPRLRRLGRSRLK